MPDSGKLDTLLNYVQSIDQRLTRMEGALGERCAGHQRQLDAQQQQIDGLKKRNGNGTSTAASTGFSNRALIALIAVIAGLVEIIKLAFNAIMKHL